MNILQTELQNKCSKHPEKCVLLININQIIDTQENNIYLCEQCISEDTNLSSAELIAISDIIQNGEKQIIQKWPPVNNHQILKDLNSRVKEIQNYKPIQQKIIDFFTQLKKEIIQQLDVYQKKIINHVCEHDQIIEQYQKISKINQLRGILIENNQSNLSKIEDLRAFITESQTQKEQNTAYLVDILKKYSLLEDKFKQENLNCFKEYILSFIKTLKFFDIEKIQEFNQDEKVFEENQKQTKQIMNLISNKTNYCSKQFLNQMNEQLKNLEPIIMMQLKVQKICEKEPIKFELLDEQELDLISEQVDHLIKLKSSEQYKNEIQNSQQIKNILKNKNNSSVMSEFDMELNKYLVETHPFAIKNTKLFSQMQILYCFKEELKSNNIKLKSNTILIKDQNNEHEFGLINPPLNISIVTRLKFKITQLRGWIGVGICFARSIKEKSYKFLHDKIGYGYYFISQNGYSWSHSYQDQHCVQKSFNFITGDIICIEFNPIQKKLKFYNKSNNLKYNMDIQVSQNDEMVPCVCLCVKGDEVEILNNQEDLDYIEFD
ncbi:hypothetical protein ABPG72_014556 [Tetrahymena utriculariae]